MNNSIIIFTSGILLGGLIMYFVGWNIGFDRGFEGGQAYEKLFK